MPILSTFQRRGPLALVLSLLGLLSPVSAALADPPAAGGGGAPGAKQLEEVRNVLETYCGRCHGKSKVSGTLDVYSWKTLTTAKAGDEPYVIAKDKGGDKSYLWQKIKEGMPPAGNPQPSEAQKKVILDWIESGAADYTPKVVARPFVSVREVLAAIEDHQRSVDEEDRTYLRYFTLTHLHNDNGIPEATLRMYRAALSKALNSMHWKPNIVFPQPVDKYATVFAIDLRDLDWDKKPHDKYDKWKEMLRFYPYGLSYTDSDDNDLRKIDDRLYKSNGKQLIHIRGDWFVSQATRPPLYYSILRLPDNALDLERKLGVDIPANFKRNRLWRAGFKVSGVSRQNRIIERHDALYGAYWKSYDFKPKAAQGDIYSYPLGPDLTALYGVKNPFPDAVFKHDGGEMIFNLPNGLQAYFLVDGKDKRINEGPTDVVYDKNEISGSIAIVNGVSCMNCHKIGMISEPFKDEVRTSNSQDGDAKLKVRQLYPAFDTTMRQLLKADEELFMKAVRKAVKPFIQPEPELDPALEKLLTRMEKDKETKAKALAIREFFRDKALDELLYKGSEPVGLMAVRYAEDLDLNRVAYELGYDKPDEFKGALKGNQKLRELGLGGLAQGNKLKRADWDQQTDGPSLYQRVAGVLGIGSPRREGR